MARRLIAVAVSLALSAACAGHSGAAGDPAPTATAAPVAAAAPRRDPSTLRYAAGAGRYRIETQIHTVQDMMGNVQEVDARSLQLMSAQLAAEGAGLAAMFRIDSISSDQPGAAAAIAGLIGRQFRLTVSPTGRFVSGSPPDSTPEALQISTGLRDFFPTLPAVAVAGHTWVDTVTTDMPTAAMTMSIRSVRTHRVVGWEDREGVRSLHITTASAVTLSGSGETNGQPLELEGSGTGTSDRYVSAAGVFLGSTESDSSLVNVNVVSMGMTIPVTRTQRTTTTRLP